MAKHSEMIASKACATSIDFETALAILASSASPLDEVKVPLADAGDCYLRSPVHARIDAPRFDCAAMDGYAIRDRDLIGGGGTFDQIGVSYAGARDAGEIGSGQTVRVMTGAPLPRGADRVVMIEHCQPSNGAVRIDAPPVGKPHIRRRGSDFTRDQLLIPAGAKVTPATVIAAAAADHSHLNVSRRPNVRLIATGDEIAAPGTVTGTRVTIPDSLTAAIELLCHSAGARLRASTQRPDDPDAIASAGDPASTDIVVVLGGASRGDRDHSRAAFASLGLEIAFADVAIKPGKPVWYGKAGTTHILGLPGNPAAALTVARIFLVPLIVQLMGGDVSDALPWRLLPAVRAIEANGPREAFLCAATSYHGVEIGERQEASGQARLAGTDALVRRPADAAPVPPGTLVPTLALCC
ncbi:MAG TPA: molybdopterin molybdotransferase MoeA [Sphingopyxis sp.]|nr:molybdopterin molybdotransferase MoeA [Sphingopyxis sp.]